MLALAVALVGLVLGPVSSALAGPPQLTIEVPEGSPTNNPTPQLRGHTNDTFDEVTVKIQRVGGGGSVIINLSPVGEEWSVSPAQNLQDGEYAAQATQTNAEGETGQSGSVTFRIDTSSPTVVLNQPAALSNNPKPSFSGTASDTKPVIVHIFSAGHPEVTATSGGGGAWSASNEPSLPSGSYTAVATQESSLGNPDGRSNEVAFTVKTQGPAVTLNAVPTPTNIATPTLSGAAGTAVGDNTSVTVRIFQGASPSGTVAQTLTAPVSGTGWSVLAAHLADGTYTAQAEQSDQAGNTGKSPTSSSFVIDTVAPSVSLVPGSKEKHTPSPVLEGSAGTAHGDLPGVTLKVYAGASVSGAPVRKASVVSKNGKWSVGSLAPLASGTYTAQAEQADEAGNRGLSTPPSTFTISSNGPAVTLTPVAAETNNATPSFSGSAALAGGEVRLLLYAGAHAEGTPRELIVTANGSNWSAGPVGPLNDATYTAIAEECGTGHIANCPSEQLGISQSEATFTVDTVSPTVTLSSPSNGSSAGGGTQLVEGTAGTAAGDASTISVRLASGPSIGGQTLQTRVVANEGGHWHTNFEGLTAGTYTTQAEQSDAAGNAGVSQASTFALTPAAVGAAPTAAFTWVPSTPQVGQAVSLLSTSSDPASPISGYAWDLTGLGSFSPGGATNTTTFSSVGNHIVRLHVAAADGLSGLASETIAVIPATYPLMRPFPIVRLASIGTRSGIRLKLLRVQAPNGALISVTCHNRGCPVKSQHRTAVTAASQVSASYAFHKFERALRGGVVLEVRVWSANQIGKYTRYTIRKGKLPQRVDLCLSPGGAKPIACPSR